MAEPVTSRKTYFAVFLALLALLILSVVAAQYYLGNLNTVIALGISVAKAILIVLFFMHLLHSSPVTRLAAIGSLLWLGIMLVLTLSDYETRAWSPELPNQPTALDREEIDR